MIHAILCLVVAASPNPAPNQGTPQARADQQARPDQSEYYTITPLQAPEGVVLEAGAICQLSDGRLAVGTRRGEIWIIDQPESGAVPSERFHLFAQGLHEPLGLAERDGWLYVVQRPDVSRIRDTDGDGLADEFEVVAEPWEISGDYHEYNFGSKFDGAGNLWTTSCLTGSFNSDVLYRGWCLRITPDGKVIPTCSGIRSPGGMAMNADGDMFYTDNQGPWNGTCALKALIPGKFVGHPGGFKWYEKAQATMGPQPKLPQDDSRFVIEADKIPEYEPPAVLFPYNKMGQSAAGIACDLNGKFGIFKNQLFVGDQTHSTVMRVYLEKVNGHYQGACFPFLEGFASGNVGLEMTPNGKLFVGGTNRGWGSRGPKPFALERVDWTGKSPFEILEIHALSDGFELVFSERFDPATAVTKESFNVSTFTYLFRSQYGSPEVDATTPSVVAVTPGDDGRSVRLKLDHLERGHIHQIQAEGIRSVNGQPLWHPIGYYTLNYIPQP